MTILIARAVSLAARLRRGETITVGSVFYYIDPTHPRRRHHRGIASAFDIALAQSLVGLAVEEGRRGLTELIRMLLIAARGGADIAEIKTAALELGRLAIG